jgi:hypothetical protein
LRHLLDGSRHCAVAHGSGALSTSTATGRAKRSATGMAVLDFLALAEMLPA